MAFLLQVLIPPAVTDEEDPEGDEDETADEGAEDDMEGEIVDEGLIADENAEVIDDIGNTDITEIARGDTETSMDGAPTVSPTPDESNSGLRGSETIAAIQSVTSSASTKTTMSIATIIISAVLFGQF